jgi:hypothetical protein
MADPADEGAPELDPEDTRVFYLYIENDFFAGTDRHYTNAVKLTWLSRGLNSIIEDPTLPKKVSRNLDKLPLPRKERIYNVGLSLGQNIYTPEDTDATELIEDDRPYAAWMYAALALHAKTQTLLDSFELSLGWIGSPALGRQTQNTIHRLINDYEAEGWDNQLDFEPTLMLTWRRTWRELLGAPGDGFGWDVMPHVGLTAGNVFTFANAGGELRLGWNLPSEFGASRIQPGGGIGTPSRADDPFARGSFGIFVFGALDARLVARNIFLDGNSFRDSHSVDKNYTVFDAAAGIGLFYRKVRLNYSYVYRSDEFQGGDNFGQLFGSVSLGFTF